MWSVCLLTGIILSFFLSVNYEKVYFEMVQVASLILDEGEQINFSVINGKYFE